MSISTANTCPERARLADEYNLMCRSLYSVSSERLLEAARVLQAHKDSCPACQREAVEIERTRRREGIAA